jgi:hypothetical protein
MPRNKQGVRTTLHRRPRVFIGNDRRNHLMGDISMSRCPHTPGITRLHKAFYLAAVCVCALGQRVTLTQAIVDDGHLLSERHLHIL